MLICLQALDGVAGVPTDCGADCGSHRLDGLALHTPYGLPTCDLTSWRWRLVLCHCWAAAVISNCKNTHAETLCPANNAIQPGVFFGNPMSTPTGMDVTCLFQDRGCASTILAAEPPPMC